MKLQFHPEAEEELLEAVSYYESEVAGLGGRLLAEVESLAERLLATFPYYLIYSVSGEVVYVVAVAHERRRPGYWKHRESPS